MWIVMLLPKLEKIIILLFIIMTQLFPREFLIFDRFFFGELQFLAHHLPILFITENQLFQCIGLLQSCICFTVSLLIHMLRVLITYPIGKDLSEHG